MTLIGWVGLILQILIDKNDSYILIVTMVPKKAHNLCILSIIMLNECQKEPKTMFLVILLSLVGSIELILHILMEENDH